MNLPNKLTLTRIILVPVFMIFVSLTGLDGIVDGTFNATFYLLAGIVFAAASFTDFLDGHLARKWNMVTDFGKFAAPLADTLGKVKTVLQMLSSSFYFFGTALSYRWTVDSVSIVVVVSIALCWLVAAVTAISGIKYLWDNRSFINTAK